LLNQYAPNPLTTKLVLIIFTWRKTAKWNNKPSVGAKSALPSSQTV
jgi:hypothetical protein